MRRPLSLVAPLAIAALLVPTVASAQDVPAYFEENCAVCHTIGGGGQAGPDLEGSTDRRDRAWLTNFLLDPEGVVASGDSYAAEMVKAWEGAVMPPTEGLTHEMAEALLDYIARESRAPSPAPTPPDRPVSEDDLARGAAIFTSHAPLANGGPGCFACHELGGGAPSGGGRLGPDLTAVHTRLGGRRGTTAWLARPPTPVMGAMYRNATLTADEAHALSALFERSAAAGPAPPRDARPLVVAASLAGVAAALAAIAVAWRGRLRGVRQRVVAMSAGERR